MQSTDANRPRAYRATSTGCFRAIRHQVTLTLAALCVFSFALCAQPVFAAVDIYVYKDQNRALSFTSVPTRGKYTRVIRIENKPETKIWSPRSDSNNTFIQLFRNKETGYIGYLDGETFIPLWPESYTTLTDDNTAFASSNEYEDIWVNGLSEQVGPIKMRQGLPLGVTVTAVDWLIEQNLDKYKPGIASQSSLFRTTFFIIVFVVGLAFLLAIVSDRYKNLVMVCFLVCVAMYNHAFSNRRRLTSLLSRCFKDYYNALVKLSVLIHTAIGKYALGNCCRYCSKPTENETRICNECQIRLRNEQADTRERTRQEREHRTSRDNDGERQRIPRQDEFDPYVVLRITRDANREEIKAAYLDLIKQYHPDRVSHLGQEFQKLAEEKAQLINRAYELLAAR